MIDSTRKFRLGQVLPWLFFMLVFLVAGRVVAQIASSAAIINFDVSAFPRISAYLTVQDEQGDFIPGIQADQIVVFENGVPSPLSEFNLLNSGAAFALVINPGSSFAIRDGQGFSRYDHLLNALSEWAMGREGQSQDDLSLFITSGPEMYHLSNPEEWLAILVGHQADFRNAQPSLDVLDRAIDITAGPSPRPGMGRAVLFITPPLDGDFSLGLQSLASRARQQGVRIFVWMVASPDAFSGRAAEQLADTAYQTGGFFFTFSGIESIPDLDGYLEPLRSIYHFGYDTQIDVGGTHELIVEIYSQRVWRDGVYTPGDLLTATVPFNFDLDIRPPNLVFISPPSVIERKDGNPDATDPLTLFPQEQTLEFLVEFPDRLPRPLVATTLFVNGTPVAQNTDQPFDRFQWNLTGYLESADYVLRVEAVDNLGLTGASIDLPISIAIDRQPRNLISIFTNRMHLLVGLAVFLSGLVLFLVLILGGGLRPKVFGFTQGIKGKSTPQIRFARQRVDPLTQPVDSAQAPSSRRIPGWINPLHWTQRSATQKVSAYLTCLSEKDQQKMVAPLPVTSDEVSLGRDPLKSILVLDDPSIDPLHARVLREGDRYRILDEGSVAGTWVNYTPVSKEGTLLEHGDLVHIGRMGFRFMLRKPARQPNPVVLPQEPPK
jgi:hypothetical protein